MPEPTIDKAGLPHVSVHIAIFVAIALLVVHFFIRPIGAAGFSPNPGAVGGVNMGTLPTGTPIIYDTASGWADYTHSSFSPIWGNQGFHSDTM